MSKNKNDKNTSLDFDSIAAHVGLLACSIATLAGLVEVHENRQPKHVSQVQPTYAHAVEHNSGHEGSHSMDMRKEKEEIRHAAHSYGVLMRSHPIAGRA